MPIEKSCPNVEYYVEVIARAFREKPVILKATGGDETSISVFGLEEKKCLPYPASFVYEYEPELFKRLETAYTASDAEKLEKIWKQEKHYVIN